MPNSKNIKIESAEKSAIIRFINPAERNPLSVAVLEDLHDLIDKLSRQANLERIIFTGSEDVFASGANLHEISLVIAETAREFAERGQSLMKKIAASTKLTIAAVNGFCFGGALDLALSCRMRIAAPNAIFCHPGANLGIITGWGGTQRLPRLIGEAAALEMFMTARQVDAQEALRIGLADEVNAEPVAKALQIAL